MDRTAFIDVDDTLILYTHGDTEKRPYGIIHNQPYNPNLPLIERMKAFKGNIIIWSGGGRQYAKETARLLPLGNLRYMVASKFDDDFTKNLQKGDLIVDDEWRSFDALTDRGVFVFSPHQEWDFTIKR